MVSVEEARQSMTLTWDANVVSMLRYMKYELARDVLLRNSS